MLVAITWACERLNCHFLVYWHLVLETNSNALILTVAFTATITPQDRDNNILLTSPLRTHISVCSLSKPSQRIFNTCVVI